MINFTCLILAWGVHMHGSSCVLHTLASKGRGKLHWNRGQFLYYEEFVTHYVMPTNLYMFVCIQNRPVALLSRFNSLSKLPVNLFHRWLEIGTSLDCMY